MAPSLVVHAHFYQPPRENPWTEQLSREPSAAPFHDWNARIDAECYRPNGVARVFDDAGRVVDIVNNYEHVSFDVGPTLLSWLEVHDPETYGRIIAADARTHGGMAQGWGHVILPLANERDMRTQVRWGLIDFEHRFGRPAEGMWLPEAAVDDRVMAVLAEEGVAFTILAPGQARRVRPLGSGPRSWTSVEGGRVDTARPYRWLHPDGSGRGVDVVFYDGGLSHAIAFELGTLSSQGLLDRVTHDRHDGLVTIAADGETFGHHQRWGERLAAHALSVEAPGRGVEVTNVSAHLRRNPPAHEVDVFLSSWSCAHGVGRWREDCGCSTGGQPGWQQRWRAPLRHALDDLRDRLGEVFDRRGGAVLRNPWAARDDYLRVFLGAVTREEFADDHVIGDPVEAFTLLEAQRNAMAMYTSCGWFFNDLAGLETVQILRYAARVMDHLTELGEDPREEAFLDVLDKAESNVPEEGSGRDVWHRHVLPARVDADRAVANLALVELLERRPPSRTVGAYAVKVLDHVRSDRGGVSLCSGRVVLTHLRTGRRSEHVYAALHLGALEVLGSTRRADAMADAAALSFLRGSFQHGASVTTLLRLLSDGFGPGEFDLTSALPDAAEHIVEGAARTLAERFTAAYERLFDDHRKTIDVLAAANYPFPPELRAPSELVLARRLEAEVLAQQGSVDPSDYQRAVALAREARAAGFAVGTPRSRAVVGRLLESATERAVRGGPNAQRGVDAALALLRISDDLGLDGPWERAQELVHDALRHHSVPDPGLAELAVALGLAPEERAR
ncbi:MAG TPA: DUF3536 domain-containing protein [Acidimicrobiales bacterium]|nr:DUF3536 domain-containing protein [Acidimicrobiales bacterium]